MIEATYIRTAIDELMVGTIGTTRKVTANVFEKGHEPAWDGLSMIKSRYDLKIEGINNHPSSPLSLRASIRIVNVPIEMTIYHHLPSAINESDRDTERATMLYNADMVIQALGFPGNLSLTSNSKATNIISGMLVDLRMSDVYEDWDVKQYATYKITGTAIVQVSQSV